MRFLLGILLVTILSTTSGPDSSPALAGIAHVAFRVGDVSKSRDFYRALGFEQSFEFADAGKPTISYIKINDYQFVELYGRADDSQPIGLMHICYEAANLESVWNEYTKRGLHPPPPKKARAGNLLFLFRDPENQIVEFTQYLPGSLHFGDRGKHLAGQRIVTHLNRAAMTVNDPPAELAFFSSKLAFEQVQDAASYRLRLPGGSADELEFVSSTAKPRIVFSVANLAATTAELRKRSFAITDSGDSASISDPDGIEIVFEMEGLSQKAKVKE